jgi:hypothetical protein
MYVFLKFQVLICSLHVLTASVLYIVHFLSEITNNLSFNRLNGCRDERRTS